MRKEPKKIQLSRETLRYLTADTLTEAAGGITRPSMFHKCPATVSCGISCSDVPCG